MSSLAHHRTFISRDVLQHFCCRLAKSSHQICKFTAEMPHWESLLTYFILLYTIYLGSNSRCLCVVFFSTHSWLQGPQNQAQLPWLRVPGIPSHSVQTPCRPTVLPSLYAATCCRTTSFIHFLGLNLQCCPSLFLKAFVLHWSF